MFTTFPKRKFNQGGVLLGNSNGEVQDELVTILVNGSAESTPIHATYAGVGFFR